MSAVASRFRVMHTGQEHDPRGFLAEPIAPDIDQPIAPDIEQLRQEMDANESRYLQLRHIYFRLPLLQRPQRLLREMAEAEDRYIRSINAYNEALHRQQTATRTEARCNNPYLGSVMKFGTARGSDWTNKSGREHCTGAQDQVQVNPAHTKFEILSARQAFPFPYMWISRHRWRPPLSSVHWTQRLSSHPRHMPAMMKRLALCAAALGSASAFAPMGGTALRPASLRAPVMRVTITLVRAAAFDPRT